MLWHSPRRDLYYSEFLRHVSLPVINIVVAAIFGRDPKEESNMPYDILTVMNFSGTVNNDTWHKACYIATLGWLCKIRLRNKDNYRPRLTPRITLTISCFLNKQLSSLLMMWDNQEPVNFFRGLNILLVNKEAQEKQEIAHGYFDGCALWQVIAIIHSGV